MEPIKRTKFFIQKDDDSNLFVWLDHGSDSYIYVDALEASKFDTVEQAMSSGGFLPGHNSIVEMSITLQKENKVVNYVLDTLANLFAEEFNRAALWGHYVLIDMIKRKTVIDLPSSITAPKVIIGQHRFDLRDVVVDKQKLDPEFDAFVWYDNANGSPLPALIANEDLIIEIILKSSTQSVNYHTLDYSVEAAKALLHSLVVSSIGDSVNRFMEANKSCISDVNAFLVQVTESFIARS